MGEDAKAVMVLMKQGGRTISGIEQAEKLTSRDRHELIQTEIRECIRDTVHEFGGQWVTIHDIVKLARLRYPDMEPYFENKSIAEYLKFMVIHKKMGEMFYKCTRRLTPLPDDPIYGLLWSVVESLEGHWITAPNISHLACAKYPDMRLRFRTKSVAEYLKFMGLVKKEIKSTAYFCGTP
jgi:hypothetical protein